jgi:hypothetical protein
VDHEYSNKICFVIFEHSYNFLRILEVCTIFWELNQLENKLKSPHSAGPNPARGYSAWLGGLPCMVGRKASWAMACWPSPAAEAARVPRGCVRAVCAGSVVITRSPRMVARSLLARWWLAGNKVLPVSSWGPPGGRRARRGLAGLTEVVAR